MITNEEARQLMYDWHGGQATMLYQAASSGLVSDWLELIREMSSIQRPDYTDLKVYLVDTKLKPVRVDGARYLALPWSTHY